MRIIYIRHADKDFSNGNSEYFKHDPGITEIGVERSKKIATQLIELYGEPNQIISSPYRRTRETSLILNSMLKNPLEEIKIDADLSEYLGNHNDVALDVTVPTKIHNPPHPETFEQMRKRVKKHLANFRKREGVIWIVTHGLIIRQISIHYNIKTSKQIPYLTCFSILERADLIRAEFLLFKNFLNSENETDIRPVLYKPGNLRPGTLYKPPSGKLRYTGATYRPNYQKRLEKTFVSPKTDYTGRDDITGRF